MYICNCLTEDNDVPSMFAINLLLPLLTGEGNFSGIDDHNVVTSISVGGISRLVLTHQKGCDVSSQATNFLVLGIEKVPSVLHNLSHPISR